MTPPSGNLNWSAPGDEVVLDLEVERLGSRGGWGTGRATVDGEEACRARLLFVTVPAPTPDPVAS